MPSLMRRTARHIAVALASGRKSTTIPVQGWSYMEKGITKLKRILEGDPDEESFDAEFYMMLYT